MVRREYARLAPAYDRIWRRYLRTTISQTLHCLDLRGDERVLDVGCGTGLLLEQLAARSRGLELHGIDATPEMLRRAERRLGERAQLRLGTAERLPYADSEFDVVTSTSMLHLLADRHDAALAEWVRVLGPGGRLVITDWRAEHLGTRAHVFALRILGRRHYRPLASYELAGLMGRHGVMIDGLSTYRAGTWGLVTAWGVLRPA